MRPAELDFEDVLPEQHQYRDEGCELYSSCLNCPLPSCRHDHPGGAKRRLRRLRDSEVRRLRREGHGVQELAQRFGVSRRTIHRIMRRMSHD